MGRPSLTAGFSARRPTRSEAARAAAAAGGSAASSPMFPRRFPRLGREFQVKKIPKEVPVEKETSQRPSPEPMSKEFPFRTADEIACGHCETNSQSVEGAAGPSSECNRRSGTSWSTSLSMSSSGYGPLRQQQTAVVDMANNNNAPRRRGGELVHQPSSNDDAFLAFAMPLVVPLSSSCDEEQKSRRNGACVGDRRNSTADGRRCKEGPSNNLATVSSLEDFKKDLLAWYCKEEDAKQASVKPPSSSSLTGGGAWTASPGGSRRRIRLKRQRTNSNLEDNYNETKSLLSSPSPSPAAIPLPMFGGRPTKRLRPSFHTEEEEALLKYQLSQSQQPQERQQQREGPSPTMSSTQVEWKLLVDLTAGRASSCRRAPKILGRMRRFKEENQLKRKRLLDPAGAANRDEEGERKQQRQTSLSLTTTTSWRSRCEREGIVARMIGDYRSEPVACYPYFSKTKQGAETAVAQSSNKGKMIPRMTTRRKHQQEKQQLLRQKQEEHERQGAEIGTAMVLWKAILDYGKAMQRRLTSQQQDGGASVTLSDILSFVSHSYHVKPTPDQICSPDLVRDIDTVMQGLLQCCVTTRRLHAKLLDLWNGDGVDVEAANKILQEQLDKQENSNGTDDSKTVEANPPIVGLAVVKELMRQLKVASVWQLAVDKMLKALEEKNKSNNYFSNDINPLDDNDRLGDDANPPLSCSKNDLVILEAKVKEASSHGFVSKGLAALKAKLDRAYQLQNRIRQWRSSETKEPIKYVAAMVRDIYRVKLVFPEASSLLAFQREAEEWVDRTNVAIRSRISLKEIKDLIAKGQSMPLDLSDMLEKLQSRVLLAEDWLARFQQAVPRRTYTTDVLPEDSLAGSGNTSEADLCLWMQLIRQELLDNSSVSSVLHELSIEGSRIPVELAIVKSLQVELDARNWSLKASKWIPTSGIDATDEASCSNKKVKLEDLREHLTKAVSLRKNLVFTASGKQSWVLEGEKELVDILEAAEGWLSKYGPYLQRDRSLARGEIRRIVDEADLIPVNLGVVAAKMSKILTQVDAWHDKYASLLKRCSPTKEGAGNGGGGGGGESPSSVVELSELDAAVEEAESDVWLDFEEAAELKVLADKIKAWLERVGTATSTGGKRSRRGCRKVFTVGDLQSLVDEAAEFPVNTFDQVKLLQEQLTSIQTWQARAASEFETIATEFGRLRETMNDAYGRPSEYSRDVSSTQTDKKNDEVVGKGDPKVMSSQHKSSINGIERGFCEEKKAPEEESDSASTSEASFLACGNDVAGACNKIQQLIKNVGRTSRTCCSIVTPETEMAESLENVSRWCVKSLRYLEEKTQLDAVFDKRFFGAFDRFIAEGKELTKLVEDRATRPRVAEDCDDSPTSTEEARREGLVKRLFSSWGAVVADQAERLEKLLAERDSFVLWCDKVEHILFSDDRKPTIDKLRDLAAKSKEFPSVNETVQKVRNFALKVDAWIESVERMLESSEEKPSLQEAKSLCDDGDKLGVLCNELRMLKNGIKAARGWANRVRRCKLDQGATHVKNVRALIEEHNSLIVVMPEELTRLRRAMRNYCICRRPYEGFMIGCDCCDEWFHGPCVGVTESRADKTDKFVCVRCSVSKVFRASSSNVVSIIRKWTNDKDFKKARQVEAQKHQRKVRKETKDIEKYKEKLKSVQAQLDEITAKETSAASLGIATHLVSDCPQPAVSGGVIMEGVVAALPAQSDCPENTPKLNSDDGEGAESREKLAAKLLKLKGSIQQCESRLVLLAESAVVRKQETALEDTKSSAFRTWCVRVRSLALVPSSPALAALACPNRDGSLSAAMISLIADAGRLGLHLFHDFDVVVNAFKCLAWSLRATAVLARRPTVSEVEALVAHASSIKLPDEKASRMMKSMLQRAKAWAGKVTKALTPVPGEVKPFDLDALRELAHAGDDIPLGMPLESRLLTVIEDRGVRHCLCGGPSDGRFMLSCDHCDRWFHGHCVNISKEDSDSLDVWKCPLCEGNAPPVSSLQLGKFHEFFDVEIDTEHSHDEEHEEECSPVAPKLLWPPYGLFGSEKATEVLGRDCCAIPDDTQPLILPTDIGAMAAPGQCVPLELKPLDPKDSRSQNHANTQLDVGMSPATSKASRKAKEITIESLVGRPVVPFVSSLPAKAPNDGASASVGFPDFAAIKDRSYTANGIAVMPTIIDGLGTEQGLCRQERPAEISSGGSPASTSNSLSEREEMQLASTLKNMAILEPSVPAMQKEAPVDRVHNGAPHASPALGAETVVTDMLCSNPLGPAVQDVLVAPIMETGFD